MHNLLNFRVVSSPVRMTSEDIEMAQHLPLDLLLELDIPLEQIMQVFPPPNSQNVAGPSTSVDDSSDQASTFAATEVGFGSVGCKTMSYGSDSDLVMSASSLTTEMYSASSTEDESTELDSSSSPPSSSSE